jgi:hypothetical protein
MESLICACIFNRMNIQFLFAPSVPERNCYVSECLYDQEGTWMSGEKETILVTKSDKF